MVANATTHRRANAFAQALDAQAQDDRAADAPARDTRPDGAGERDAEAPGAPEPPDSPGPRSRTRAARAAQDRAAQDGAAGEGTAQNGAAGDGGARRSGGAEEPSGRSDRRRGARPAQGADALQERMLTVARALSDLPSPSLDPDIKAAQRARLVAAAQEAAGGAPAAGSGVPEPRDGRRPHGQLAGSAARLGRLRPRSRWGRGLAVSGLAVGVAAGGLSGAAVASSDALPGDTLYGLKRSMEDLRLTMADDDTDRGEVYLDMASTRLKEARRLMDRAKSGPLDEDQLGDVRRALSGMHDEAARGHDLLSRAYQQGGSLQPIEKLASFSDTQRRHWSELSPLLPEQLSQIRDNVSSVLDAIEQDVIPLRALLPVQPRQEATVEGGGTPAVNGRETARGKRSGPSAPAPSTAPADRSTPPRVESERQSSPPLGEKPEEGLLGGLGLPIGEGPPKPSGSTSPPERERERAPEGEITLPPLLPDLLPDLGLGGGRTDG
ncbi:DUF5667 domain-containing protein [Streptomyces capparidis]